VDDASLPCFAIASKICELLGAIVVPLSSRYGYDRSVVFSHRDAGDVVHVAVIVRREFGNPILELSDEKSVRVELSWFKGYLAQLRDKTRRGVPCMIGPGRRGKTGPLHSKAEFLADDNIHGLGV
jgi:hypothetical protein